MRDELKQLLNDDHDMANLYLSKKLPGASSPSPDNDGGNKSDTGSVSQGGDIHIVPTADGSDDDFGVEELEVILEVSYNYFFFTWKVSNLNLPYYNIIYKIKKQKQKILLFINNSYHHSN